MTKTYSLAPEPFWTIIDVNGLTAGGASMKTLSSLTMQNKPVYMDAGGNEAWPNPIVFGLNGTEGPFYFEFDSDNPDDLYYLEVRNAQGNLLWDIDDFQGGGGSGGGGNVTTYLPLRNYITNNQFIDHIDDTASPIGVQYLMIAPSNHKGFTPSLINPVIGTYGIVSPDIYFNKSSLANTDQITFPDFALASAPLTGDVTPVEYVRYVCTTSNPGETYKNFQFPITQKVKNLSNQQMTLRVWAAVTTTPVNIKAYVRQYFGSSPTASPDMRTAIGADMQLTTTWTQFNINFVMPDVSAFTLGTVGAQTDDDAIYIQIEMPLNEPCDVLFTKPKLYLGDIDPALEFENYDEINSINSTPRTGDVRTSMSSSAPKGWVPMNDGTIGNVGSGATTRANKDTFQLYKTIWDGVGNAFAPVSGGRGANAIADFIANKTLKLPVSLGRALAGAGAGAGLTSRALGENTGTETRMVGLNEIPNHTHNPLAPATAYFMAQSGSTVGSGSGSVGPGSTTGPITGYGAQTALSLMQPTSFMNIFIKL